MSPNREAPLTVPRVLSDVPVPAFPDSAYKFI